MKLMNMKKRSSSKSEKLAAGLEKRKERNLGGSESDIGVVTGDVDNTGTVKKDAAPNDTKNSYNNPPFYDSETGTYAVRQSLLNAGINNIGWDGENVVSNGEKLKPLVNRDGTTYAAKKDVEDFIHRSYFASGNPLVRANSYTNSYGLSGMLDYDTANKKVTVDGREVGYAYIDDDGNAWVPEKSMDAAYEAAAQRRGISESDDLIAAYKEEIKRTRDENKNNADSVKNYDYSFEKLKNDPVYKAYREMYEREGKRAYKNSLAEAASRNGGGLSATSVLQAGQMMNHYLERVNDAVPQIAKMAYERFLNGVKMDYSNRESIAQDAFRIFSAAYDTNRERIADANALIKDSKDRFTRDEELKSLRDTNSFNKANNALELIKGEQDIEAGKQDMLMKDREMDALELDMKVKQQGMTEKTLDMRIKEEEFEAQKKMDALELSKGLGYYTDDTAAILGIQKDENGNYPSVNYAEINKQIEMYDQVLSHKFMTEQSYKRNDYDYKLEQEYKMDVINMAMEVSGKVSEGGNVDEAYEWALSVLR